MQTWIWITLAAAIAQTLRFMLQKHLKTTRLSTAGATFARFIYSAPFVAVLVYLYLNLSGQSLPGMPTRFWGFALAGGLAQILATTCVVALFAERNFAVGITFKKTEVLLTVLTGFLVLGETVTPGAGAAVALGFVALIVLSDPPEKSEMPLVRRIFNRASGLGLTSGVLFSISAVGYRGASLALEGGDVALRAGTTLAVVTAAQSLAMLAWFALRDRQEPLRVLAAWRTAGLVGLTSMIGSFCWFVAFTLQNAAYVKAVGQIELVFSVMASTLVFREKISKREMSGIGLLMLAIVALVLAV